jgi:exosortase/archaeosortase family protein
VRLHLANITLEVAQDCTSVPILAALIALGVAYGLIQSRPMWIRVALTLAAVPLGLAANILRLILTALGASYLGQLALDNIVHRFAGTTVFLATLLLLALLDEALVRASRRSP